MEDCQEKEIEQLRYFITDRCRGCGMCAKRCPKMAIRGAIGVVQKINYEKCIHCGKCMAVCHFNAVEQVPESRIPEELLHPQLQK